MNKDWYKKWTVCGPENGLSFFDQTSHCRVRILYWLRKRQFIKKEVSIFIPSLWNLVKIANEKVKLHEYQFDQVFSGPIQFLLQTLEYNTPSPLPLSVDISTLWMSHHSLILAVFAGTEMVHLFSEMNYQIRQIQKGQHNFIIHYPRDGGMLFQKF